MQSIVSQMQASYGMRVLFIFDGWDEFPHRLMNDSLVSTIIQQPHELSLDQRTVLITSRPVSSGNLLLHIADRRVEILGFTRHQIREYIEKALDGNSTHIQKLIQHLEEHPVIEGYCYVPLHSAILVHTFLIMKEALPTTLHELFCSLVLCCIVRERTTHELQVDTSLPELSSLDDLPDDLKSKLINLSILAYNGVMQNKVVFHSKDLQASHLPSSLPSLGLLQAVEGLTLYSKSLSYNFLHLSVQELLAAYNISQMVPSEQVKVFKELFSSSRFQAVLHYYCGFTKLDNPEIQSFISSFQTGITSFKDLLPLLHCFFEAQQSSLCRLIDSRFIPNEHQRLNSRDLTPVDFLVVGYFITSLLSTSTANTPTIHLLVDGIDDHRLKMLLNELSKYHVGGIPTSTCTRLVLFNPFPRGIASSVNNYSAISELVLSYTTLLAHQASLVGYFITSLLSTSNTPTIHLVVDSIDDRSLVMLTDKLSNYPVGGIPASGGALSFRLSLAPYRAGTGVSDIASLLKLSSAVSEVISELVLCNRKESHYREDVLLPIAEALQTNTSLTNLCLPNMSLHYTKQNGSALTKMLQVNKSLTHLDLSNNDQISDSGARCIFEGLQHNTALINLNLSQTGVSAIDPDTARSLTKMLQVNKSLTHLDLSNNDQISDSGARCIFEGLQHNTALINLNLSQTGVSAIDPDTARSLTKMLQVNKSLTHLDLSKNKLSDSGDHSIFEGLQYNTTLVNLNLSHTGTMVLNPDTALSLTKMLQENKSLKHLNLSHHFNNTVQMIMCIFEGLKHNSTLHYLDLHGVTCITDSTAEHISGALQLNCTLQTLDISECLFLGHSGIDLILESLMFNSTLQTLYVSNIDSETLSTFKRARETKNLLPIVITPNDAYLAAEIDFTVVKEHIKQQGSVDMHYLKSYLIGPSGVGKTATRRRLTREIDHFSPNETGIDAPLTVQLYRDTEQSSVLITEKWKSLGLSEQCPLSSAAPSSSDEIISDTESIDIDSSSIPSPLASDSIISPNPGQDEITSALRLLIKKKDWKKIREFLKCNNSTLLHIVDIGGQPEFHEILPLLLHGHALNLIFLNMTQDLDSSYQVIYRDDSNSSPIQYECEFTIKEIIQRALHSITSLQSNTDHSQLAAILIGTHLDKCSTADVLTLEQSIRDNFANFIEDSVLCSVSKPGEKKYIYLLNNVSGDSSDIEGLRELITTVVHDRFMPEPVPTATLLLHLILHMKFDPTPGWCSLEECIAIAERCSISREDLTKEGGILQYLHDRFGTILHYRGLKIGQRVIVNTNLVTRPPVELFVTAFGTNKSEQETAEKIRRTGEIPHRLMEKVCSSNKGRLSANEIPTNEIVELLMSRYILYENAQSANEENVYFLPCLLYPDHNIDKESQDPSHLNSLTYPPILIIPETGYVPLGPFPATVVKLSQSKHWILAKRPRFRNRIRFYFHLPAKQVLDVELRALSTHLEFRIRHDASSKPINTCLIPECLRELRECFDKVLLFCPHTQGMKWDFGFYCPHAIQSGQCPHPARCCTDDEPQNVICSQEGCKDGPVDLEDKHKCWFTVSDYT